MPCGVRALAARPRQDQQHQHRCGQGRAGVLGVFTGADVAADNINGLPCGWLITSTNGEPMKEPPHPILAQGKVRYVGDHGHGGGDTLQQARDAAELVEVDYDVLPPWSMWPMRHRAVPGAVVHDIAPDNHCYKWAIGDKGVDAVFASAAHVTKLDLVNNRLIPNAMEPRAAIGSYNRAMDEYTLYVANQNPHVERLLMTAFVMGLPEHKVRVIAPDVGGGFGSKIFLYAEDVCLTWAPRSSTATSSGRPTAASPSSDAHGRDHVSHAEMAMDKDGKFLAMRVHTDANLGAYLSTFASAVPTILTPRCWRASTPRRRSMSRSMPGSPTPRRWMPTAARAGPRPPTCSSAWSAAAPGRWASQAEIRRRNFITSFPPDAGGAAVRHRRLPRLHGQAEQLADVAGFERARPPARPRASSAAWATAATSRPAAWRPATSPARWARAPGCSNAARCACTPRAA
jgi:carbon-monoxide dehydrogenase large subunit